MNKVKENILNFLSILEGNHQTLKMIHWSTTNKSEHLLSDEIDGDILKYQDRIAEAAMGCLNTRFGISSIKTLLPNAKTISDLINELDSDLNSLKDNLSDKKYSGINNILDDFSESISSWKYLVTLK